MSDDVKTLLRCGLLALAISMPTTCAYFGAETDLVVAQRTAANARRDSRELRRRNQELLDLVYTRNGEISSCRTRLELTREHNIDCNQELHLCYARMERP